MKEISDNWSKEEFKGFLLYHIANADLKINNSELFIILNDLNEVEFRKIEMVWSKSNDFECLQLISQQRNKHFPGDDGKELLLAEVIKLANADEKFSIYEQNVIMSLKKIL